MEDIMRALNPSKELNALFSVAKTTVRTLSKKANIPQWRVKAVLGGGILSIDEYARCKATLEEMILERARSNND
jgi:hypothetical protein